MAVAGLDACEKTILIGFAAAVWLLYLFYLPFDQWWYLRFLIPAIPIVLLLGAEAAALATHRSAIARTAALSAVVVAGGIHTVRFMDAKDLLVNTESEKRRYLDAAIYFNGLPADAVVLAMQHSGSVRYYAGRLTMRWDVLDAGPWTRRSWRLPNAGFRYTHCSSRGRRTISGAVSRARGRSPGWTTDNWPSRRTASCGFTR